MRGILRRPSNSRRMSKCSLKAANPVILPVQARVICTSKRQKEAYLRNLASHDWIFGPRTVLGIEGGMEIATEGAKEINQSI